MEYAIIETGGKQYKVTPGMILEVESLGKTDGEVNFEKVLLLVNGENVNVGMPHIADFKITGKVMGATKGTKIYVSKFKSKVRYRRTIGHRQSLTQVEIMPFSNDKTVSPKKAAKKS